MRRGLSPPPSLLDRFLAFLSPFQNLPTPWWPCPMRRIPEPLPYQRLPPRRGGARPAPRTSPSRHPKTVRAESADPAPGNQPEQAPAVAPEPEPEPRHPVHLTPAQMRRVRQISRQNRFEQLAVACSMGV